MRRASFWITNARPWLSSGCCVGGVSVRNQKSTCHDVATGRFDSYHAAPAASTPLVSRSHVEPSGDATAVAPWCSSTPHAQK